MNTISHSSHTSHQESSHQKARMFWGTRGGPVRAMSSCTLIGNEPISKKNFASPQLGTRPCPHGRALVHALASTNSPTRTLMLMLQSSLTILLVVTSMQQAKGPTVCGRLTRGRLAVAPCDRFPCMTPVGRQSNQHAPYAKSPTRSFAFACLQPLLDHLGQW